MTAADQWVWLARIRRTQGRKGEVFADILTDFPEKFADRKWLWLVPEPADSSAPGDESHQAREVQLIAHWLHKGGIVLHFAGVHSISDAEKLTGLGVAIPRSERAQLAGDETYISDLIGCALVDLSGPQPVTVGTIEDVDTTAGPAPLLVVARQFANQDRRSIEILVPFAKAYLRHLDLEHKRVEMDLPEGLVALNES